MKRSNRLTLVVGVVLAVAAFGGVLMFGGGSGNNEPPPPQTVAVVTAAIDLALGTPVSADQLTTVEIPVIDAVETYRDPADVVGRVVRRQVAAGEVLNPTDFAPAANEPGFGLELAADLEPGQRALAVQMDALSAVGSIVQPGDYVDVVLNMETEQNKFPVNRFVDTTVVVEGEPADHDLTTWLNATSIKILVQNVQVLGVVPVAGAGGNVDPNTGEPVANEFLFIMSVTPQEAEMIRFAQIDGNISFLLRAPGDQDAADDETTGVTLRELVDEHGVLPPKPVFIELP